MPQPSSVPGRKFSISTSAPAISRRAMSWPSLWRKSSAIERLLRDCTCHQTEVPPSSSMRQLRSGSPAPGGSILITSAPKSPRVSPTKGPAISWPISITRRPCKAPGVRGMLMPPILRSPGRDGNAKDGATAFADRESRAGLLPRQVLDQQAHTARHRGRIAQADQQAPAGPVVFQLDLLQRQGLELRLDRIARQHGHAHAGGDHLAHGVEAAHMDAYLEPPAQGLGL